MCVRFCRSTFRAYAQPFPIVIADSLVNRPNGTVVIIEPDEIVPLVNPIYEFNACECEGAACGVLCLLTGGCCCRRVRLVRPHAGRIHANEVPWLTKQQCVRTRLRPALVHPGRVV